MRKLYLLGLLTFLLFTIACNKSEQQNEAEDYGVVLTEDFYITLKNTEEYNLDTKIGGDEEGASVIKQAQHYRRSEIVRNSYTDFKAIYSYIPEQDYVGYDYVEIEICSGSDGTSPICPEKKIVKIEFKIVSYIED